MTIYNAMDVVSLDLHPSLVTKDDSIFKSKMTIYNTMHVVSLDLHHCLMTVGQLDRHERL